VIKGHVAVALVMQRFSERTQAVVNSIITIVTFSIFGIVAWWLAKFAYHNYKLNIATETMEIPLHPFIFVISFGCLVFLFVLLNEIINSLAKVVKK